MARLITAARLGVVVLLAVAILGAVGTYSFRDVSAAGRAGAAKVPALFKDNGNKGGNGNGHGGGNGNGNAGQGAQQGDDAGDDADQGNGHGKKNKKAKKDKAKNQAEDAADDEGDEGDDADSGKNPQSGNVDCDDVEDMIEYLTHRNMNGAIHANENGADNAALGALNKCKAPGQQDEADEVEAESGTPVAEDATPEAEDGTPVAESGTPIAEDVVEEDGSDDPVSVKVDIDEDGNGTIEYDLDGDGETDLTMIVEDGKVVEYVEADDAAEATPDATPDTETE